MPMILAQYKTQVTDELLHVTIDMKVMATQTQILQEVPAAVRRS